MRSFCLDFQADLIHLGAKYSPCMRVDENVQREIVTSQQLEGESACCVRNDGSGSVQTQEAKCSVRIIRNMAVDFLTLASYYLKKTIQLLLEFSLNYFFLCFCIGFQAC